MQRVGARAAFPLLPFCQEEAAGSSCLKSHLKSLSELLGMSLEGGGAVRLMGKCRFSCVKDVFAVRLAGGCQ